MNRFFKLWMLAGILVLGLEARAASSPMSLAIVPGIQYPADDYIIRGLRIGVLWGNQTEVYGLDIGGIGNVTQTAFGGSAIAGLFNLNKGSSDVYGVQFAGLGNFNMGSTTVHGVMASLLLNYTASDAAISGIAIAPLNIAPSGKIYGAQLGIFNKADEVFGLQIGLINVAKTLHGVQIGFLNFHEAGIFQVSPILNIGF